ncbi:Uncharacterised protein [Burkholderia pseudomallei]|uniref:hypothetical protein n=1 Tax=Burkholderia pseudomallei TaxID=28450 RepID=UPI000F1A908D|nr:hypothetical protein [Burkholderia pseudomallei]MCV9915714.1 hypothetical protein [Burkholderia pseudomallei]MCV9972983.1 hypothetical protein [Burkholderia pseudomallei]MCW0072678.1 hypothetical protein [Burkholderia pseudomallei]CAJ4033343.1 Uncharacterised protein [Burkholderia pseudomallei]CAJ4673665.1 Uncharacterised protein [Burkholderia pseudomallei]
MPAKELRKSTVSASNVIDDPKQTLQTFNLLDLQQYTSEGAYSENASNDVHLFYVGRDDVHDILKHILSRVSVSLYLNMFGYDDPELNDILMQLAEDQSVTMLVTLDRLQAKGVKEKGILSKDLIQNAAALNTHFAIGESLTHQISHTKGFVADGRVAFEGSTNWSATGEGIFITRAGSKPVAGGVGYKAQNNTACVITDPDSITRFQTELIREHMAAASQDNSKPADALGGAASKSQNKR